MKYIILLEKKLNQYCVLLTKNQIFLLILLISCYFCGCKSNSYEHNWTTSTALTTIPDSLKNENAVIILNERKLSNVMKDFSISEESNYKRIKLLTLDGITDFSTIEIPKIDGLKILELDARTIKPNGKIIDFNSKDIKEISSYIANTPFGFSTLKFSVPSIEVGDEIEIFYKTKSFSFTPYYKYFFHFNAPALKSIFVYTTTMNVKNSYSFNNQPPKYQADTIKGKINYKWEMNNLHSLKDQDNCIIPNELPNIKISLLSVYITDTYRRGMNTYYEDRKVFVNNYTWTDFYSYFIKSLRDDNIDFEDDNVYYKKKKNPEPDNIDTVLNIINKNLSDTSKYDQFLNVCKYIHDSVAVVNQLDSNKLRVWSYLEKKTIDKFNLYRLYLKLFNYYDIEFAVCCANKKEKGDVDIQYSFIDSYTDIFFAFKKDTYADIHYIYPSDNIQKFGLDELPIDIRGTNGIIISNYNTFPKTTIKSGNPNDNFKARYCNLDISLDSSLLHSQYKTVTSGALSTISRTIQNLISKETNYTDELKKLILQENPNAIIDSLRIEEANYLYPHKFNLYLNLTEKDIINTIDSNTYSLSLNTLLDHDIIPYHDTKRWLDFYTDFPYKDSYTFNLNCKYPSEIINADNLSTNIENTVGSYFFKIDQITPTQYAIRSNYTIKADYIPKDNYVQIDELNKASKKIKNASIILKIKR